MDVTPVRPGPTDIRRSHNLNPPLEAPSANAAPEELTALAATAAKSPAAAAVFAATTDAAEEFTQVLLFPLEARR